MLSPYHQSSFVRVIGFARIQVTGILTQYLEGKKKQDATPRPAPDFDYIPAPRLDATLWEVDLSL